MVSIIHYSPSLASLRIGATFLDTTFSDSANGSLKLPFLRELTLDGLQPGAKFVSKLLNALDAPNLSSLNLLVASLGWREEQDEPVRVVRASTFPKLTSLSIMGIEGLCEIYGMTILIRYTPKLHSLKLVNLSGRWGEIGAAVRRSAPKLRRIEIEDCDISLIAFVSLFGAQASHTSQPGDQEPFELIAVRRCLVIPSAVAVDMEKRTRKFECDFEWDFEWKDPDSDTDSTRTSTPVSES